VGYCCTFLPYPTTTFTAKGIAPLPLHCPPCRSDLSAPQGKVISQQCQVLELFPILFCSNSYDSLLNILYPHRYKQRKGEVSTGKNNRIEVSKYEDDFNPPVALKPRTSTSIPDRGHSLNNITMDPFEVRLRFTQHLQHLNASVTSANKAAQYALKYRDMDEDLHSCILEQLERVSGGLLG
jgi:hypothetical protein